MTGNEEKKWPLGRGPAFHSSQSSLCASELQKCAHDGTSGHFQQTWSTTFLGWHRSGGPGMIPHCTNSKNLQVFLGIIICTLLSLKYEGCGRKILEGHGVFQPIKRGFNGYGSRVWWILGSCNTGRGHSRAVCQANLQRLGIHIINAHSPSLQTDLDFFSHALRSSGHLRLVKRQKRKWKWEAPKGNWMAEREGSTKLTKAGENYWIGLVQKWM